MEIDFYNNNYEELIQKIKLNSIEKLKLLHLYNGKINIINEIFNCLKNNISL